jgi:hypothetical protein
MNTWFKDKRTRRSKAKEIKLKPFDTFVGLGIHADTLRELKAVGKDIGFDPATMIRLAIYQFLEDRRDVLDFLDCETKEETEDFLNKLERNNND